MRLDGLGCLGFICQGSGLELGFHGFAVYGYHVMMSLSSFPLSSPYYCFLPVFSVFLCT